MGDSAANERASRAMRPRPASLSAYGNGPKPRIARKQEAARNVRGHTSSDQLSEPHSKVQNFSNREVNARASESKAGFSSAGTRATAISVARSKAGSP